MNSRHGVFSGGQTYYGKQTTTTRYPRKVKASMNTMIQSRTTKQQIIQSNERLVKTE